MQLFADLHTHTTLSACCHDKFQTAGNIVECLSSFGVRKIALTDHVWANPELPCDEWYAPQNPERIFELKRSLAECSFSVPVLVGCEAEMLAPGRFGITPDIRERLDLVLMASDHFHIRDLVEQPEAHTPEKLAPHLLKFFCSAAESGLCDILVHPLCALGYMDIYDETVDCISDAELFDALSIAATRNVGVEINASILCRSIEFREFHYETMLRIFEIARNAGCKFTFGSDSHSQQAFRIVPLITDFADRLGLTAENLHPLMF